MRAFARLHWQTLRMTEQTSLWTAIVALARRNKMASIADIERASGVARTTLNRIRDGEGGRGDALAKLDQALGLEVGTLESVKDGDIILEDILRGMDAKPKNAPPGTEFRLRSLEQAVEAMRAQIERIEDSINEITDEAANRQELDDLRNEPTDRR